MRVHLNKSGIIPIPLFKGKEVYVIVDSSLSNSGVIVYNVTDNEDCALEFSAPKEDWRGVIMEISSALKVIFSGATILGSGIEDVITKSSRDGSSGIDQHSSRVKITTVFTTFVLTLQELSGKPTQLLNNQAWKKHTLPPDLNKKSVKKGSKVLLARIGHKYASYKDDVTDAWLMWEYYKAINNIDLKPIARNEVYLNSDSNSHTEVSMKVGSGDSTHRYNGKISYNSNVNYLCKEAGKGKSVSMVIPIECVPLNELLKSSVTSDKSEDFVRVSIN